MEHRPYDPNLRPPLPNDIDFVDCVQDFQVLFTSDELQEQPYLFEYIQEVLARWGRWAARKRPHHLCFEAASVSGLRFLESIGLVPNEYTARIEYSLALAMAGVAVDEIEPHALPAMREKAVALLADEFLEKASSPFLSDGAKKRRSRNRKSRAGIRRSVMRVPKASTTEETPKTRLEAVQEDLRFVKPNSGLMRANSTSDKADKRKGSILPPSLKLENIEQALSLSTPMSSTSYQFPASYNSNKNNYERNFRNQDVPYDYSRFEPVESSRSNDDIPRYSNDSGYSYPKSNEDYRKKSSGDDRHEFQSFSKSNEDNRKKSLEDIFRDERKNSVEDIFRDDLNSRKKSIDDQRRKPSIEDFRSKLEDRDRKRLDDIRPGRKKSIDEARGGQVRKKSVDDFSRRKPSDDFLRSRYNPDDQEDLKRFDEALKMYPQVIEDYRNQPMSPSSQRSPFFTSSGGSGTSTSFGHPGPPPAPPRFWNEGRSAVQPPRSSSRKPRKDV